MIAQRELEAVVRGFQSGLLERAFELRLLTLQQFERVGAVSGNVRGDLAVAIDVEMHVDATEFGRVETNFKLVGAGLRPRDDCDRKPGDRNRGGGCRV